MASPKKKQDGLISKTALLEREGWTLKAIEVFKLAVEKTSTNPVFKCAAEVKLYSLKEIKRIEKTKAFKEWKTKCLKRKEAAAKGVATKKAKLIQQIQSINIYVEKEKNVLKNAIESYNDYQFFKRDFSDSCDFYLASQNSDQDFLDRIIVNYIRHNLTSYDEDLDHIFGKTGKELAYMLISQRIFKEIATTYPEYAAECERQFFAKFEAGLYEDLLTLVK